MEAKVSIPVFFDMSRSDLYHLLPSILLTFFLMAVYLAGMAPGLTWAHYGADGGDLITAAAIGGVPHPTGYPVYLVLARIFQFIPIGSLAYRTNLLSACAAVASALLAYTLVLRSLNGSRWDWLAGLASALAFGLSPLLWSQALITEVYTLHVLFVALVLYVFSHQPAESRAWKRRDFFLGLVLGLAIGSHVTSVFLMPVIFDSVAGWHKNRLHLRPGLIWRRLAGLSMGLSVFFILPLHALTQPPVNWGNPVTLKGFWWLVSGSLYRSDVLIPGLPELVERLGAMSVLLLQQFGLPGLIVGLTGLVVFFPRSHLYAGTLWIAAAFMIFALVYPTHDSAVYILPACLSFALWIGLGLGGLADLLSQRFCWPGWLLGSVLILFLFFQAGGRSKELDISRDLRAENFGHMVIRQAPANAILFAMDDRVVFTLWYFHFALQERSDLAVVAADLLHFPWYQETLQSAYPDLSLPGPFPFPGTIAIANPARPACYVQYEQSAQIDCFPAQGP
jgi:hypothetical protein